MEDPRDIILSPVVSEKSYAAVQNKRYSFFVDIRAKKSEIKRAIEEIFKVKVLKISTINIKSKPKRLGRSIGTSSCKKRAVVTLGKKDKIDFFESV
ncbi:MAG: 50S ribosomal protein L23 [Actinobacteria bacterium RBG_13_35_12]|jgi:large subunit ribosomal protein L23|nr:MAG: 50S ribosomal protein L23 [Actinobacteria bacterium RBG_13_35_12]